MRVDFYGRIAGVVLMGIGERGDGMPLHIQMQARLIAKMFGP